jgi:hypothetical protein
VIVEASRILLRTVQDELLGKRYAIQLPDAPACPRTDEKPKLPCLHRMSDVHTVVYWSHRGDGDGLDDHPHEYEGQPQFTLELISDPLRGPKSVDRFVERVSGGLPVAIKRVMPDNGVLVIWESADQRKYVVTRSKPIDADRDVVCNAAQSADRPLPDFRAAIEWATRICESWTLVP